jgi:EAL domain-containing protein (putative c-di-GMP-specific phosphodiesterase class I)
VADDPHSRGCRTDGLLVGEPGVAELTAAFAVGRVIAWFQPIVTLVDGGLVGFEALARWRTDDGRILTPDRFLPLAQSAGLMSSLDRAVARDAFARLRDWAPVSPELRISINVAAAHVGDDGDAGLVDLAAAAGIDPSRIDVEITESDGVDSAALARASAALRSRGFRVWLDDFGTGWNTIERLLVIEVDGVKIDRAFAAALTEPTGRAVVRAMVAMAAELGLRVVLEGVETEQQREIAAGLGCEFGQGFLWSRPVAADLAEALILAGKLNHFAGK